MYNLKKNAGVNGFSSYYDGLTERLHQQRLVSRILLLFRRDSHDICIVYMFINAAALRMGKRNLLKNNGILSNRAFSCSAKKYWYHMYGTDDVHLLHPTPQ